jgi:glucose/galactose transporter
MTAKNNLAIPILIIGVQFFFIGFALGINSFLIPFFKKAFSISSAQAYLILASAYTAFVVCGYPSGKIIKKIGYKRSMMISFLIFAVGFFLFIPSARYQSFPLFLLASFISGAGNTLLQAAVNPYITIIGPIESAAKRISIMGILNKLAWAAAPIFLSLFLNLNNVSLSDVTFPFMLMTVIFVIIGVLSPFLPLPEIKIANEENSSSIHGTNLKTSIFQFPHLLLGVAGLFLFSGVEVIALASIVDFASNIGLENPEQYGSYTVIATIIGYICGVLFIPKKLTQTAALQICACIGIISSAFICLLPLTYAIYFVALLGLGNSLIWPTIWPLAIADLGEFTNDGAALLVMGIAGGAVIPLLFGLLSDLHIGSNPMQMAYLICVPIYLYLLFYAKKGHKIRLIQKENS